MVDRSGFAQVNLWLTKKVDDASRVRQALEQSLGFPLKFDEHNGQNSQDNFEEDQDISQEDLEGMADGREWTF